MLAYRMTRKIRKYFVQISRRTSNTQTLNQFNNPNGSSTKLYDGRSKSPQLMRGIVCKIGYQKNDQKSFAALAKFKPQLFDDKNIFLSLQQE